MGGCWSRYLDTNLGICGSDGVGGAGCALDGDVKCAGEGR